MDNLTQTIVSIAAMLGAVSVIYKFIISPIKWGKVKKDEIDTKLQELIHKTINEALLPIRQDLDNLSADVQEIRDINVEQIEKLEWMNKATLDLLRQEILYLYNHHYHEKKLTIDEHTQLHKLYDDYVSGGGNSFVQSLVEDQMSKWEIIPNNNDTSHK